ncbi:MAG TPA: hypothetical protein VL916_01015, partial [Ilumatobacteraceae bacterium]|nr:hypothetical protein [Ilumatobacteraceae bacterium]
ASDDTTATIRLDDVAGTERTVPLDLIDRARTVFVWQGADKPGKARSKNATKSVRGSAAGSAGAGTAIRPKGPSDELDRPIEEEATA